MKKRFFLFVSLLVAFSFVSCKTTETVSSENDIVILYTNDVHCGVDDHIGYAGLALYRKEMLEQTPYVTLVDAGDAVQGGTMGAISHGEYIITLMNELKYDVAIPGNHEFDYGMKRFDEFSRKLKCGYVASNFRDKNGKRIFPAYKMISYGKTKVAFVGVCTPESITKSNPATFQDAAEKILYSFGAENDSKALYDDVQDAIDSARKKGADYVILVAHLGEKGVTEQWSAMSVISRISGADAVIDGHSHEVTPSLLAADKTGKKIPITQTGTKLANIGKLTIARDGTITTELVSAVPQENGEKEDTNVVKTISDMKNEYEASLAKKLITVDFDLIVTDAAGHWLVRHEETNLSDLFTDAMKEILGADIGLLNAGAIRSNIKKGDVTVGDVFNVFPFENLGYAYEMTGQTILDALEFAARKMPENNGGLLHSSGLSYKINTDIPSGAQTDKDGFFTGEVKGPYRVHDVRVNGEPLDVSKTYTVAGLDYVVMQHGDGQFFKDAKQLSTDVKIGFDILKEYIETLAEKNGGKIPETYRETQKRLVVGK